MTNSRLATRLVDRLSARTARVALAVELSRAGLRTTGFDLDEGPLGACLQVGAPIGLAAAVPVAV